MRISDWSSDVCSSDLKPSAALLKPRRRRSGMFVIAIFVQRRHGNRWLTAQNASPLTAKRGKRREPKFRMLAPMTTDLTIECRFRLLETSVRIEQIGRASWRARVWQEV